MADEDTKRVREEVGGIVYQEEVESDQGDGDHVTQHDPTMEVAELRELDVDEGGDDEEQGAEHGGDGVHQPQGVILRI